MLPKCKSLSSWSIDGNGGCRKGILNPGAAADFLPGRSLFIDKILAVGRWSSGFDSAQDLRTIPRFILRSRTILSP